MYRLKGFKRDCTPVTCYVDVQQIAIVEWQKWATDFYFRESISYIYIIYISYIFNTLLKASEIHGLLAFVCWTFLNLYDYLCDFWQKMPSYKLPKGNGYKKKCHSCGEVNALKVLKCKCGYDFRSARNSKRLKEIQKRVQQGKNNRHYNNSTRMISKAMDTVRFMPQKLIHASWINITMPKFICYHAFSRNKALPFVLSLNCSCFFSRITFKL